MPTFKNFNARKPFCEKIIFSITYCKKKITPIYYLTLEQIFCLKKQVKS